MSGGQAPRLAAVVVALGDDPDLAACLEALAAAALDVELILVENGAAGPAPALPLEPRVRIRRAANPGFTAAINEGLAATRAEHVLTLNPDARLAPGGLHAALALLAGDPRVGAVAFRLLRPGGLVLDSAGIRIGPWRRPRDRGMGREAAGLYPERETVDAACMACALFRRVALEDARDGRGEILDSRFFAYKEDADLGWRLRRAGWKTVYEPRAVAFHVRRWREGARASIPLGLRRASLRNRYWMMARNESAAGALLRLPLLLGWEAAQLIWLVLTEPAVLPAYRQAWEGLPECLRRRKLKPSTTPPGPATRVDQTSPSSSRPTT